MEEKTKALKDKLFCHKKNGFLQNSSAAEEAYRYCEGYKSFLNAAKTERECVAKTVEMAEKRGFKEFVKSTMPATAFI